MQAVDFLCCRRIDAIILVLKRDTGDLYVGLCSQLRFNIIQSWIARDAAKIMPVGM
jgi:hypothetical protein